jgi:hypothetical protein
MKKVPMYIKNVATSIKYSGEEFMRQTMPSATDFLETNSELLRSVSTDLRNYKNVYKQAKTWWDASSVMDTLKSAKDNAVSDLKSGNFYNKARSEREAFKASGWEDVLGGFGDEMSSALKDYNNSQAQSSLTNNSINRNTEATVNVVSAVGQAMTNMVGDSAEYIVSANSKIASNTMVNNYRLIGSVNNLLSSIDTNVKGIFEFMNNNITKYFNDGVASASNLNNKLDQLIALTKESTEMTRNQYQEYDKSKETKYYRSDDENFLTGGTFNVKEYIKTVGQRVKTEIQNSALGSMTQGGVDPLKMLASNPLSFVSNAAFNKMISKDLKDSMQTLDKTISGFFKSSFLKMSSGLRQKGNDNQIFNTINRILGINTSDPGKMKTGLYVKGPVPWNGMADRALTEVLPTYLRKILSALTGKDEMVYDYESGKFNKIIDVKDSYDRAHNNSYGDVSTLKEEVSRLINNMTMSNTLQEKVDNDLDKFFKFIVDKGVFYNPNKATNRFLRDNGVYLENGEEGFNLINNAIRATGRQRWNEFNGEVLSSIERRHNDIAEMSKNGQKRGYTAVDNGFDSQFDTKTGRPTSVGGIGQMDKYNRTIFDYMRDIRHILLEGIRVFPTSSTTTKAVDDLSLDKRIRQYEDRDTLVHIPDRTTNKYNKSDSELQELAKKSHLGRMITSINDIGLSNDGQEDVFKNYVEKYRIEQKAKEESEQGAVRGTLNKFMTAGKSIMSAPGKLMKDIMDSVNDNLLYFLYGSKDGNNISLIERVTKRLNDFSEKILNTFNTKIINPLNKFLFDEKDGFVTRINNRLRPMFDKINSKLFDKDTGFFTNISNKFNSIIQGDENRPGINEYSKNMFSDIGNGFMNVLYGKEYTSKVTGEKHEARKETMFSIMKGAFTSVKDYGKNLLDTHITGGKLVESVKDTINRHTATASRVLFGSTDDKMSPSEFFSRNISPRLPKSLLGSMAGLGLSLFTPLGIVGGLTMGATGGFMMTSDRFKTVLFGEHGSDKRMKIDNMFKAVNAALPRIGVGALAGGALSLFTPFGLIGGTMLGGMSGFLSQSDKFKEWLFGNGADKKGIINKAYYDKFKSYLPGGALGAGMGALGSFFLPGGPVGGALVGLTLGIAGQSNMIKTYLFGNENPETGRRSGGLFGKMKLFMQTEILMPLKTFAKQVGSKGMYFIRKELLNPILDSFLPIKKEMSLIKDAIVERIKEVKDAIVDKITSIVIKPFGEAINKYFIDPMKNTFTKLFGGLFNAIKGVITAPSRAINALGINLMKKHERNGVADYKDEWLKKKNARDKKTEDNYRESITQVNKEKARNTVISQMMRKGGYDENNSEVRTAKAWMGIKDSDNISKVSQNSDKQTTFLERLSNMFSDFKKSWDNRYKNIKETVTNKYDDIKSNASDLADNLSNKYDDIKNNVKGRFKGDYSKAKFDIRRDDNKNNDDFSQPSFSNVTDFSKYKSQRDSKNNTNTKDTSSKKNNVTHIDFGNKNKDTKSKDNNHNNTSSIDVNPKDIATMRKDVSKILGNIDGQINGVGYHTELIANIMIEKFGMPSKMPKGVKAFSHKIKSIFGTMLDMFTKPKEFVANIVGKIFDPIKKIPNMILNIGKKAVGGTLSLLGGLGKGAIEIVKAVTSVIPGLLDIVGTAFKTVSSLAINVFKSIPDVVATMGNVITNVTKVLGNLGVELVKGFGSAIKYSVKTVGELTLGLASLAKDAIPLLFKSIVGVAEFIGTGIKNTVKGAFGLAGSLLGFNKKKEKIAKWIKGVDLVKKVELVDSITTIHEVKDVLKISDARLYESLGNITAAIHTLRTGTDGGPSIPISSKAAKITNGASDKEGNIIRSNIIDITDKLKKANEDKKRKDKEANKAQSNTLPYVVNNATQAISTGNTQVDKFFNRENNDKLVRSNRIKDALNMNAQKATIGTNKIMNKMFGRSGILSMVGDLLFMGLPKFFSFIKNFKKNAMQLAEDLLGKLLKKLPLPNFGGNGGSNTVRQLLNGGSKNNTLPTSKDKSKEVLDVLKTGMDKKGKGKVAGEIIEDAAKQELKHLPSPKKIIAEELIEGAAKQEIKHLPSPTKILSGGGKKAVIAGLLPGAVQTAEETFTHSGNLVEDILARQESKMGSNIIENVPFIVKDEAGNVVGKSGVKQSIGRIITKGTNTAKSASANIIEKVLNSSAVKKLAGSKIGGILGNLSKFIIERVKNYGESLFSKIAIKWGTIIGTGAISEGIIPALWYGGTILNGVSATNRMFNISPNSKPSVLMRTIAGFSAFISDALTFGIISPDTIAQFIGGLLLTDADTASLHQGQDLLQKEYNEYKDKTGEDLTLDQYNEKVNKSTGDKIWDGVKSTGSQAWTSIKNGASWVGNQVMNNTPFTAFNDDKIRETLGYGKDKEISVQDRLSMGTGSILSNMTFGLIQQSDAVKIVNDSINSFKAGWEKTKEYVNKNTPLAAFNDDEIRNELGLDPSVPLTLQDRLSVGTGAVISNMTFGLIKQSNASNAVNGAIISVKDGWEKVKQGASKFGDEFVEGAKKMDVVVGGFFGLKDADGNPMGLTTWIDGGISSIHKEISDKIDSALSSIKGAWEWVGNGFDELKQNIGKGLELADKKIGDMLGLKDSDGNTQSLTQAISGKATEFSKWVGNGYNSARNYVTSGFDNSTDIYQSKSSMDSARRNAAAADQGGNGLPGHTIEKNAGGVDTVNGAIYYSQNQDPWASIDYGYGKNISQAGCGPTSAAMLLSSVTGQTITPAETAQYSLNNGFRIQGNGTGWDYFNSIGNKYGVGFNQTSDFSAVQSGLAQGYPVILSGKGSAPFTTGGHYIMATGIDSNGNIIVNDPVSKDRSKSYNPGLIQSETAQAWISNKPLVGGVVSQAAANIAGGNSSSTITDDVDNGLEGALSKIGEITSSFLGTTIAGDTWDESKLESNKSKNGSVSSKPITGYQTGTGQISSNVLGLRDTVAKYAAQYGVSDKVDLMLAQIMQEAGGDANALANDPMQSAEGHGLPAGSLHDQEKSIAWGVEEFSNRLRDAGGDIPLALQSYNFGQGFINYVKQNGGSMNQSLVDSFSNEQAIRNGWSNYGDKQYVQHVMRYYNGGSGDDSFSPFNIAKNNKFGRANEKDFGGNGNDISISDGDYLNSSDFILNNYKKSNDLANNTMIAQNMIKDNISDDKIDVIISLLSKISDNTETLVEETKSNGDKLEVIANKDFGKTSNVNNTVNQVNSNNTKTETKDPFTQLTQSKTGDKLNNAYENARMIAKGRKN